MPQFPANSFCMLIFIQIYIMVVSEIKLYELLKARIGNQEAEAFVEILEKKVDQKFEDSKQILSSIQHLALLPSNR
jgi:hypothetical protein